MKHITMHDLMAQDTKRHPYAFYTTLREQGPLSYLDDFGGRGGAWVVTNYDDAIEILKDPRFVKDFQKGFASQSEQSTPEEDISARNMFTWRRDMLTVDPPDHSRLRGLVAKAFTPRMIEQLRPRIQQITDDLLNAVQGRSQMDLINDFAFPLPITVISEMLGIPPQDRAQFRIWTQALLTTPEGSLLEKDTVRSAALNDFIHYIRTLLAEKREHPGEDLVSGLVQAEENGDQLSETELISTVFLLIVAGHETTVNLIGNGTLALLQHPDQLRLLQQDPSLIPSAVEELLRYTSPVSLSSLRWASEDITMHDTLIHKGDLVFIALIAANSDVQHFTDPETLDIARQVNKHIAFGKGIHACLGAPLARLEGQIAFSTLFQRLPHLHLTSDPEQLTWSRTPILRGLTSLPVAF